MPELRHEMTSDDNLLSHEEIKKVRIGSDRERKRTRTVTIYDIICPRLQHQLTDLHKYHCPHHRSAIRHNSLGCEVGFVSQVLIIFAGGGEN